MPAATDTMRQIARSEGVVRGFYRGWTVSLILYAPYRCTPVQILVD